MASIISKIITEYYELVDEKNELKIANKKLEKALSLANSMILCGEKHSKESKSIMESLL